VGIEVIQHEEQGWRLKYVQLLISYEQQLERVRQFKASVALEAAAPTRNISDTAPIIMSQVAASAAQQVAASAMQQ